MDPQYDEPAGLVEHLATGVLLLDDRLNVLYLNPIAEQMLRRSRQQVVGELLADGLPALSRLLPLLERVAESGDIFTQLEMNADERTHDRMTLDCTIRLVGVEDDQQRLLIELIDASRRLRMSRDAALLSQQDASRSIARQLAHEVRNPLGGIRGAAQLLERELSSEAQREFTQLIIRESDRLAGLVDGLLGPGDSSPESLNIHEILEHIYQLTSSDAAANVTIERDYDPSLPTIRFDRGQAIQALLNLVRNALQAAGENGSVTMRTRALTHHTIGSKLHRLVVCVEIEDSGAGVPEEIRETLFYPLVTGRRDGTGLGLALAQELVSRQGGLIEYTSQPGQTIFRVLFPIEENEH
ncbi:MAG: nitrogen regulation protein NR(II) [Gammaproteobacteria bacterium]